MIKSLHNSPPESLVYIRKEINFIAAVALLVNGPASWLAPEGETWEAGSPLPSQVPHPWPQGEDDLMGTKQSDPRMLQDSGYRWLLPAVRALHLTWVVTAESRLGCPLLAEGLV